MSPRAKAEARAKELDVTFERVDYGPDGDTVELLVKAPGRMILKGSQVHEAVLEMGREPGYNPWPDLYKRALEEMEMGVTSCPGAYTDCEWCNYVEHPDDADEE